MEPQLTPEQWRLFIALEVPEPVKDRIETARETLRAACGRAALRWARREQFHLTLRFLGNVEADRVPALERALRDACRPFKPLELRARGVGFFPPARPPRVVWVGLDGGQPLKDLQAAVTAAAESFTLEPAEKEFTGHITLARVREIRGGEARQLKAAAERLADTEFGTWTARELHLVRSQLSPEGARHFPIAVIPLQP